MKEAIRKAACVGLTAMMAATFAAGNTAAFLGKETASAQSSAERSDTVAYENLTGKLDLTGLSVQNLSPAVTENLSQKSGKHAVIVRLAGKSLLERTGGESTADYLATRAGKSAQKAIAAEHAAFLETLRAQGIGYELLYEYETVMNGVAVEIDLDDFAALHGIAAVKSAVVSETYAVPTSTPSSGDAVSNPSNVYGTGIYDSSAYVAQGYDGRGMTVAILDTGLDYTHDAFSERPEALGFTQQNIEEKLAAKEFTAETSTPGLTAEKVYVSDKVPFAYDYADRDADVYPGYSNHGTHVAGIVAGKADHYVPKDSEDYARDEKGEEIPFRGVAPEAQLVICKVFTDDLYSDDIGGATSEDIVAALEDCVNLEVDVINMSLGTAAGFSNVSIEGDTEGQMLNTVYESIRSAGISLICAASNEFSAGYGSAFGTNLATNPDSGTVGSPSTFAGALSVASINGQKAPYLMANGTTPVFYTESSDANSVPYDFAKQMLAPGETSKTFKYVVVPGIGQPVDYTPTIVNRLRNKEAGEKVIAVVRRGTTDFEEKVRLAQSNGADAVIIYNNVAGTVRMSLGDLEDPIPAVSVNLDAGLALTTNENGRARTEGTVELNTAYEAGPFMNDYSSWGPTPDLKLKPEVTAHGGEITSSVPGGYDEQSGTSMASPNLAGFMALLKQYLKGTDDFRDLGALQLTELANQIVMSTAVTVYDEEGLPYSPRKQGSGLATLANVFGTKAYLYTVEGDEEHGAEGGRPKAELYEDEEKIGVYHIVFHVKNFGTDALVFRAKSTFMTETLARDGLAVAEAAYLLDDIPAEWTLDGAPLQEGADFTVEGGASKKIEVTLTLSAAEKSYIDRTFPNGMFTEGFLTLVSATDGQENGQCTLNFPFMGFYGDWDDLPMLDYDVFELAEFEKDTSLNENERPKANVWATQLYATYYNDRYVVPMGSFAYVQDEDDTVEKIYDTEEHSAVSRFNDYFGYNDNSNYLTTTGFKALYAGLLRGAELVTYDLYDEYTGEILREGEAYRVSKSYSNGGSGRPSQVLLELSSEELGLVNNGKYRFDFHFWRKAEDAEAGEATEDNSYSVTFYADYEAPMMTGARIRYYDYKDGNKDKQNVYLDVDVYDNHYPQSVLLYYSERDYSGGEIDTTTLKMATKYATPVYRAVRNGTTTVSIDITDIYEKYRNRLYVQLDDYALNHSVYALDFTSAARANLPASFEVANGTEITLGVNETHKVALTFDGSANVSNFDWSSSRYTIANVRNGEIVGVAPGDAVITVAAGSNAYRRITVHVVDKGIKLPLPTISFGPVVDATDSLTKASGSIDVKAGDSFRLEIICDPWYYPVQNLKLDWRSSNSKFASVDQSGNVTTGNERGIASVSARLLNEDGSATTSAASVILNVQEPFTVANMTLTRYAGKNDGIVEIPDDKNIMTIGEEAFKDCTGITGVIIPKTVTTIDEYAFENCTNLRNIWFISQEKQTIADAGLSLIEPNAFAGCTNLETLDLTNCKVFTVGHHAFENTGLKEIKDMQKIGTAHDYAFSGTKLENIDISGMHTCGTGVFRNCKQLASVTTGKFTPIGANMFEGCTSLTGTVTLNGASVGASAFSGCSGLQGVTFGVIDENSSISLGANAFAGCEVLSSVDFGDNAVSSIGDGAFSRCTALSSFTLPAGVALGDRVFRGSGVGKLELAPSGNYEYDEKGALYCDRTLVLGPTETAGYTLKEDTEAIAPYAFAGSGITALDLTGVTSLGEGAFRDSSLGSVSFPEGLTEISAYAFAGSALTALNVTSSIEKIGAYAFSGCNSLASANFTSASGLDEIGDGAFSDCALLETVALPDGASVMGSAVFSGCARLSSVTLPSVTKMGSFTFADTPLLRTVTYGASSTATGSYNFVSRRSPFMSASHGLTAVTLGAQTEIGESAFLGTSIAQIDLKGATKIGASAFAECEALATVTGLDNVSEIGDAAFYGCTALRTLTLTAAENIGTLAFALSGATSVTVPAVRRIGEQAFYRTSLSEVSLPVSLESVGDAAFSDIGTLTNIEVNGDNAAFFAEDGVLYRVVKNMRGGKNGYELLGYPAGKAGKTEGGASVYSIKEGTVSIGDGAFTGAGKSVSLTRVVLPYSVKGIGDRAFFGSEIEEYEFQSIQAPALYARYWNTGVQFCYSLYLRSFADAFIAHTQYNSDNGQGGEVSFGAPRALTVRYPSNGSGYDNYTFTQYFVAREELGELPEDASRDLKDILESEDFTVATVEAFAALAVNEENKATVAAFSERVKGAHALYNTVALRGETQLAFVGSENTEKMFAIEAALKPVKAKFGIAVNVESLTVNAASSHRTEYAAGETFDMTGLKIDVNYDDYTSEAADMSRITLDEAYAGALTVNDRYVRLSGYGKSVRVAITVTEGGSAGPGENGGGEGIEPALIYGPVLGVAALAGIGVAAGLLLKKKKKGAPARDSEAQEETPHGDGDNGPDDEGI